MTQAVAEPKQTPSKVLGYRNNYEHLRDELKQLDLMIQERVLEHRASLPPSPLDQFKGLVVSDEEVAALLKADAVLAGDRGSKPETPALAVPEPSAAALCDLGDCIETRR